MSGTTPNARVRQCRTSSSAQSRLCGSSNLIPIRSVATHRPLDVSPSYSTQQQQAASELAQAEAFASGVRAYPGQPTASAFRGESTLFSIR